MASALSYGSRTQFMHKIEDIVVMADGDVYRWIADGAYKSLFSPSDNRCFYRFYTHATMYRFFEDYRSLLLSHTSLKDYIAACLHHDTGALGCVKAICSYFNNNGSSPVIPRDTSSACKRINMFLRWMVRDNSPVDLGLWSDIVDKSTLIMPLDTHVLQQSVSLHLLNSKTANMNAAIKLSTLLNEIFPGDPLKGDFALFGYGVNAGK